VQAFLPLDLRTKKTRAIRRRLSKEQVKATTTRQVKRASAFPLRKFALKA
jgi:large subunit ribosomal protein L35e